MSRPSKSPQPTAATSTPDALTSSRAPWLCLLVFAVALLAYIPALSSGLIWDDPGHITRPDLRSLAGLGRIWFEIGATQQYYPILHSAFWLEYHLWGDATLGYHLLNVLLHATSACLFARLLQRLAVPGAWLAALLFALHPVCVESVAWITEQKNTLSVLFYLLSALAYLRFGNSRRPAHYAVATALFVLALLSKTVTATLPAALLVVIWWKQSRLDWRRDILPLLPWFALGALSGLGTAHFERELIGAQGSAFALAFDERLLLAGRVVWFYLGKLLWPAELIFIYPHWTVDASQWWQWLFLAAGLALLAALLWLALVRRRRSPLATALLFGGTLFPVLGFFNVYPFVFSYVADHFQYLASLAVFALAGAGLSALAARLPRRAALGGAALLLGTLGTLTCLQSRMYRDLTTLYQTTLAQNPACWMAHQNLAIVLAEAGQVDAAIAHLRTALAIKPDNAAAENNLGDNLASLGRLDEALPHLQRAVELQPIYAVGHCNLATTLARLRRFEDAFPHFATAARLDPRYPQAEQNWGIALMESGQPAQALDHLQRAVQIAPGWVEGRIYYGRALASRNRMQEAADQFRAAVEAAPSSGEANYLLGMALRSLGRAAEAEAYLEAAQQCDPTTP